MCPELAHSRLTRQERKQSRAMWALQRESRPLDGAGSHPWAPADNWQGCQRTTRQQRSPETNGKRKANPSEIGSFKSNNMENYGHARELCTCRALSAALRGCFQTQRQDKTRLLTKHAALRRASRPAVNCGKTHGQPAPSEFLSKARSLISVRP